MSAIRIVRATAAWCISLFMPASLAYVNGTLWVGEFKFSSRILKFSVSRPPAQP